MLKKVFLPLAAAIILASAPAMALAPVSLNGVTVDNGKGKSVQNIYFDFEEGIWVGIPQNGGKYQDIDQKAVLVTADGKKLAIINHIPHMEVDGQMRPLTD